MQNDKKNFIYFLNGSIGDFLMTLLFLDSLYKKNKNWSFYIATGRNKKLFQDIASEYPHVKIIDYPRGIFKFLFSKNIVITPPTPAILPWHQKLFAWLISRAPSSELFGFDDSAKINVFLYKKVIPFRTDILYFELLFFLAEKLNIDFQEKNMFLRSEKSNFIDESPYIVFHPFGASNGRSFLEEKLQKIVLLIKDAFPNHKVFITGSIQDFQKLEVVKDLNFIDFTGRNIKEVIQLIKNSNLFIGVDTGITHLANVLQKKTLVLAEQGTPHWLPYYNPEATIVYQIKDDNGFNEGREYLESKRHGRIRYLDRIPLSVIEKYIQKISHEI